MISVMGGGDRDDQDSRGFVVLNFCSCLSGKSMKDLLAKTQWRHQRQRGDQTREKEELHHGFRDP